MCCVFHLLHHYKLLSVDYYDQPYTHCESESKPDYTQVIHILHSQLFFIIFLYRFCQSCDQRASNSSYGEAQIKCRSLFFFRRFNTISAAQISTPLAIPNIKVVYPHSMAAFISRSNSLIISLSTKNSFSGLCPVKQHQCTLKCQPFLYNMNF